MPTIGSKAVGLAKGGNLGLAINCSLFMIDARICVCFVHAKEESKKVSDLT